LHINSRRVDVEGLERERDIERVRERFMRSTLFT
jgi:hypothetical protein